MAQAASHETHITAHSPASFTAWTMCELTSESLPDTDEEVLRQNMFNALLHIVTSYHTGAAMELLLTDAELARIGLGCHFALDCLCDNWNMFSEQGDDQ